MTLDELTYQLRRMGSDDLTPKIAARAAQKLEAALKGTLSAGQTPDGKSWAPKVEDDGRAFAGAAGKLTVAAYGDIVRATLTGGEVYGHFGRGKTQVARPMLPDAGADIPPIVAAAISEAAAEVFAEAANA